MKQLLVAAALLCACGPGFKGAEDYRNPRIHDFAGDLSQASQKRDVGTIRAMLRDSVTVGGLWFEDVSCTKQFAFPSEVKGPRLDELARCLTTLQLAVSARNDQLPDVLLFTYGPGLELEARIIETQDGPWLAWIGYVARRDLQDALPTVSASALEALRIEGDSQAPLAGPGAFDELTVLKAAYAWMKVCIDANGVVTGAHVREASSPHAARTFGAAIQTWKFRPFMLGSQPAPVCSMVRMFYPTDKTPDRETLPLPVPEGPGDVVNVPSVMLGKRTAGRINLSPDDIDKVRIQKSRVRKLIAALHYCLDVNGHVSRVRLIRSSGLPHYDDKLVKAAEGWAFAPFLDEGKPVVVCSTTHFVYTQK
ncbi:MAG TPA: hypothetical protein VFV99_17805 [Kofleriaceae bacterium]|nr:hypothetical protein [Kofleriaceae bacterium]